MELKRTYKLLMVSFMVSVLGVTLAAAIYYHEMGNVNYPGAYWESGREQNGIYYPGYTDQIEGIDFTFFGVDLAVNETDLNLLDMTYGIYNTTTWGVGFSQYNIDCDFDLDGYVGSYDVSIIARWYGSQPINATIQISPETLNLKNNGEWLYVDILEFEYDFLESPEIIVDPATVLLLVYSEGDGIPPIEMVSAHKFKFERIAVRNYIQEMDYDSGDKKYDITLTLIGEVGGIPFEGFDTITVIQG